MNILLIDNDEKIFYKKKDLKNITKNYNNYYNYHEVECNKLKRKTSDNVNDISKKSKISNNNFIL